jgi:uncharacterized protein (UPF0332 family)
MSLEEMRLRNELESVELASGEIGRLLAAIERRLQDANNATNHPETRLEQAYHAILNCALAALRMEGLRPTNRPGKHMVTLESLLDTLGAESDRVDYFQTLRELRNQEIYTGSIHISESEIEAAIEAAAWLEKRLESWLEGRGFKDPSQ